MEKLIYCSQCGEKNLFSEIDGNKRYHCNQCKSIHYQNPKPTATLIVPKNNQILFENGDATILASSSNIDVVGASVS